MCTDTITLLWVGSTETVLKMTYENSSFLHLECHFRGIGLRFEWFYLFPGWQLQLHRQVHVDGLILTVISLFSLTDSMAEDVLVNVSSVSIVYLKKNNNQGCVPIGYGSPSNLNPLSCPCKDVTAFEALICMSKEAQSRCVLFFQYGIVAIEAGGKKFRITCELFLFS